MTVDEFDIRFDILYNNLASNAAPALNAYEKSVFLSQAQRDIIIELYNGRSIPGISFESTEEARAYLRNLLGVKNSIEPISDDVATISNWGKSNFREYMLDLSDTDWLNDVLFITYEEVSYSSEEEYIKNIIPIVIPVKQDNLHELFRNPFKRPSKNKVFRVDANKTIYLYSSYPIDKYTIFYIACPEPIILKGINDDTLTIDKVKCLDNNSNEGSCPEILHQVILERAVALAKQAYIG